MNAINDHISLYLMGDTNIDDYTIKLCNELLVATTIRNKKQRRNVIMGLCKIIRELLYTVIPSNGIVFFYSNEDFTIKTPKTPIKINLYRVDKTFYTEMLNILNEIH